MLSNYANSISVILKKKKNEINTVQHIRARRYHFIRDALFFVEFSTLTFIFPQTHNGIFKHEQIQFPRVFSSFKTDRRTRCRCKNIQRDNFYSTATRAQNTWWDSFGPHVLETINAFRVDTKTFKWVTVKNIGQRMSSAQLINWHKWRNIILPLFLRRTLRSFANSERDPTYDALIKRAIVPET